MRQKATGKVLKVETIGPCLKATAFKLSSDYMWDILSVCVVDSVG